MCINGFGKHRWGKWLPVCGKDGAYYLRRCQRCLQEQKHGEKRS